MNESVLQQKALMWLLVLVTLAFIWILLPYYGAVFWAVILGIVFAPLQRRLLLRLGWRRNLAAGITLLVCLLIAILPVIVISTLLVQEGATLYKNIESGQLDIAGYIERFKDMLPAVAQHGLERLGMGDLEGLRDKIAKGAMQGSQFFATQAFSFGQGTFEFLVSFGIMLYLLYFFLRDGAELVRKIRTAVPLAEHQKRRLQLKVQSRGACHGQGQPAGGGDPGRARRVHLLGAGYPQCAGVGGADGVSVAAAGGGCRHRVGARWPRTSCSAVRSGRVWCLPPSGCS